MSWHQIYIKDMRRGCCALCRWWYDPTNSAIKPISGNGWWSSDGDKKARCMKTLGISTKGCNSCNQFECKIPY